MKNSILLIVLSLLLFSCTNKNQDKIDLSGEWNVALDSLDIGTSEKWFEKSFSDNIILPGTLCDAELGIPCALEPVMEKNVFLNLKRKFDYIGVAWYSREIVIPDNWKGKTILLKLERIIWNSQVWINNNKVNFENESLVAPHQFDLTAYLSPGKHKITIRIDNRKKYNISVNNLAHAYTNDTQTMWNGILGELSLNAKDKVRIGDLMIFPDVDKSEITVNASIINDTESEISGELIFYVKDKNGKIQNKKIIKDIKDNISFNYNIKDMELWDEFNPYLYEAVAEFHSGQFEDIKISTFGMRKLTNNNALLQLNDKRIFLRGTLECCIFPLEGYPPLEKPGWEKVFKSAKKFGINHIRFHSWCPPKAAFEAADEMGIYLQAELPLWELNIGKDPKTTSFLFSEANKIITEYGNHPSFCFWSMGNELQGDFELLDSLMLSLKEKDSRHLYTTTTFTFEKGHGNWPEPNDDFWISQWTKKGWVRGQGIFDSEPVNFDKDYSASIDSIPVPVITHEIGQYSVFPNLKEIEKYTGNLLPLNFIAVKNDLEKKGLLEYADDYLLSSGKLAAILYKEEIERALKTPGISGFQLLDLHDFPGQGTALVGLIDAFWESKGIISPEEFYSFNSPVVPLVRLEKATYKNNELLKVKAEIANFSNEILQDVIPVWSLSDSKGNIIEKGELPIQSVQIGNGIMLGDFSVQLSTIENAEKLILSLNLKNTDYKNQWDIWVYPAELTIDEKNVFYTRNFSEAENALQKGKKVLLNPSVSDLFGLEGKFVQVFWSPVHFPNQPGTMGILCDPAHQALKNFPTEMHSNWQWWDLCKNAKTMVLDSIAPGISPIIRMIDNFYKNRNLGLAFEAKVGEGKLLICSSDLASDLDKRSVSKQLLFSLLNYMNSDHFNPTQEISFDRIKNNLYNKDRLEEQKKSIYD